MNQTAKILEDLERALLDPATRGNGQRVADLLAEDFVEFGSSGRIWTREATIAALSAETPNQFSMPAVDDLAVRPLSDGVALVTYATSRDGGKRTLRSSIWRLEHGAWRMAFHQGTVAA
jgi:hypothetical protein